MYFGRSGRKVSAASMHAKVLCSIFYVPVSMRSHGPPFAVKSAHVALGPASLS